MKPKNKGKVKLTPEQNKVWVATWEWAMNNETTNPLEADTFAYDEVVEKWPELKGKQFLP